MITGHYIHTNKRFSTELETEALEHPHVIDRKDVYLQRSLRKFVIVMCMMIEMQDLGVQKRCPP